MREYKLSFRAKHRAPKIVSAPWWKFWEAPKVVFEDRWAVFHCGITPEIGDEILKAGDALKLMGIEEIRLALDLLSTAGYSFFRDFSLEEARPINDYIEETSGSET